MPQPVVIVLFYTDRDISGTVVLDGVPPRPAFPNTPEESAQWHKDTEAWDEAVARRACVVLAEEWNSVLADNPEELEEVGAFQPEGIYGEYRREIFPGTVVPFAPQG